MKFGCYTSFVMLLKCSSNSAFRFHIFTYLMLEDFCKDFTKTAKEHLCVGFFLTYVRQIEKKCHLLNIFKKHTRNIM